MSKVTFALVISLPTSYDDKQLIYVPKDSSDETLYNLCTSSLRCLVFFIAPLASATGNYSLTILGTLGGMESRARSINASDQVIGSAATTGNALWHATLWNGMNVTDLGPPGGLNSWATDINDSGLIVGYTWATDYASRHATLWNGTSTTDLGTLGGRYSEASDINDFGQIVGIAATTGAKQHATLWNGTIAPILTSSEKRLAGLPASIILDKSLGMSPLRPMLIQSGVPHSGMARASLISAHLAEGGARPMLSIILDRSSEIPKPTVIMMHEPHYGMARARSI